MDFDPEFEFARQQKSTIDNFPMKEIDQEEMSEAAIAGALQVQTKLNTDTGKPIYQKMDEDEGRKQSKEAVSERDQLKKEQVLLFSQELPSQLDFQPIIYEQPTGRTYTEHHTTTLSRP